MGLIFRKMRERIFIMASRRGIIRWSRRVVHNTITIDGRDQMTRGGRFLTLDWFPAYSKSVLEADEKILGRVLAYHKGYRRLGIRHERMATVFTDERWEIKDNLIFTKPGEHVFRLHWLLMDGEWEMRNRELGIGIRVKSKYGWITLNINRFRIPNSEYRVSLVRAGELIYGQREVKPYEGWISPTYGQKIPALSLAVEIKRLKSVTFISEFIFPKIGMHISHHPSSLRFTRRTRRDASL